MEKDFLTAVAKLCHVHPGNLSGLEMDQIVERFILPLAVKPAGEERGSKISKEFMQFMADYGQYCMKLDRKSGELLMELAMQRISQGTVLHDEYDLVNSLPISFQAYTTEQDQLCPMRQADWNFIKKNILFCCQSLATKQYIEHACKILKGLLVCFSYDGTVTRQVSEKDGEVQVVQEPYGSATITFNDTLLEETPREIYLFAENTAILVFSKVEIAKFLEPMWREKKHFFKRYLNTMPWDEVFGFFDLDKEGERYFNQEAFSTVWMQLIGAYPKAVKKKILQEIADYNPV
ncbi:MAG: hypothetical protein J6W96_03175 [Alphaproteobacteria bacterium]|nr:hypothetical protein [Alphaproteobacteria bacterium]